MTKNKAKQKLERLMTECQPASGFKPETEAEHLMLQQSMEDSFALSAYISGSIEDYKEAKKVAHMIFGGEAGRILVDATFCRDES